MPVGTTAAIIGGGASLVSGIVGGIMGGRARRRARRRRRRLQKKLRQLEANRQAIINPYEGITDLSSLITNPFSNLGVATGATEIQIEQTDIALANTLDTLRATGASAGGATALAQAALQSKKNIAANIEQQELSNERQAAQGEQAMMAQKKGEQQRLQQADVAGRQFVFREKENREIAQLNRVASQIGQAAQAEQQAASSQLGAITGALGGIANVAGSYYGAKT
jgi:hypothetical protein